MDEETRRRELSLAEFEAQEIEEAGLVVGEDEELEELYRKMTESRKVTEAVAETYHYTGEAASGMQVISSAVESEAFRRQQILMKRGADCMSSLHSLMDC